MATSAGAGRGHARPAPSFSVGGLHNASQLRSALQRATALGVGAAALADFDRRHPSLARGSLNLAWLREQRVRHLAAALSVPLAEATRRWGRPSTSRRP